ncbi:hypothetical protein [Vitiosangium sp. GDMCC 1.1324]|uniref:hypothetical protein n=1 Tax=Vitiosangium sp. (strain GDMCC 1.1324) TaxID=2138576 RepID=UPI000D3815EE|nr:hypothetical protein [Vitiosangium sp. GDMCC 1.1324]PTL84425.1 hypothetical protein DAT35_04850 [Vitiosangium sp. GDMCC 1.1324]
MGRVLGAVLSLVLAGCASSDENIRPEELRFGAYEVDPDGSQPFEFFIHGTTHAKAVEFEPKKGARLFTTTDIHVARLFSQRTVGREGGRVGAAVIAIPREIAVQLRERGVLKTQPVPDMPQMLETIFEPGAVEVLKDHAAIRPLPEGFFEP